MTEQEWEDKLDEVQKHSEYWYNKYKQAEKKIADLEKQIEKMKCCGNCKHFDKLYNRCELTRLTLKCCLCNALDKWELREIKEND